MGLSRALLIGLALGCFAPGPAAAAERWTCLTPEERTAAIAGRKAVPLGRAMRVVKARVNGEVVGARLCRQEPKGLVYVLTVLARNGKVTHGRVDASDGHWLGGG
jgi:uncharacterized membrane protein YkoI